MNARAILSFSRDLEFATEAELAKRMGCERGFWLRATVKELIDNALDSAEEAGIATPEIGVRVDDDTLTVADNGPGMSAELVERLCNRSERTSTREAFAAPDRGSQGNALQVIMSLPFGFGHEEAGLTITSQGVEHAIRLRVNRLEQRVDLDRTVSDAPPGRGTMVSIRWPEEIDLDEVEELINEHAWLNPHASFWLNDERAGRRPGGSASGRQGCRSRRTGTTWTASRTACCWRSSAIPSSRSRSSSVASKG